MARPECKSDEGDSDFAGGVIGMPRVDEAEADWRSKGGGTLETKTAAHLI
jgi:hypothetical protein